MNLDSFWTYIMRLGLSHEKRKGQTVPYLFVWILFLAGHAADSENWWCPPSLKGRQKPAPVSALPGLPAFAGSTGTRVSDGTNLATSPFFKNKNN